MAMVCNQINADSWTNKDLENSNCFLSLEPECPKKKLRTKKS